MSHFTRVKTKLKDVETLKKVLIDMGHEPVDDPKAGHVVVRGWGGQTQKAEMKVARGAFDIGFVRNGDSYEAVGDFSGMHLSERNFGNELNRRYAHATVLAAAEAQGFTVAEEVQQSDGSVRVVVERWA